VRVVGQEGAEAATVRRIAREGGFTVGVLAHYFRGKDEIVAFAFRWIAEQSFAGLAARVAAERPGKARLRAALEFMLPAPGTESFPGVWMGLWGAALRNRALARVHRDYYARWRRCLQRQLAEAVSLGQVRAPGNARDATDLLVAAVDGLWIGAALEPGRFPAARRRALVGELLARVLGGRA
jgi:AcrR family transcriptional regulator